eukprot:gnl/MRDRNA2_/MRDRNA2_47351_c0_seq1.p1 gnl/MRDRNA2_/MRDRNA2_47351_c0~~gnl/MRDRNA2_/MRDRNA2_47351_c0_seq1.p1  ORF type:complete len:303 (+),score=77.79 gnl/MRDRNA2_/MRDRNA2_47351_c0_seq1:96-1004(+)
MPYHTKKREPQDEAMVVNTLQGSGMDLGNFADKFLETAESLCGEAMVESPDQARRILDCLLDGSEIQRVNAHELAAVLGMPFEKLQRCRTRVQEDARPDSAVFDDIARCDATFTWNMILQRINEAAHWRIEFKQFQEEMQDDPMELEGDDEEHEDSAQIVKTSGSREINESQTKAIAVVDKVLIDASESLREFLTGRLAEEVAEHCPDDLAFRQRIRSVVSNLKRNQELLDSFISGRVPPRWLATVDVAALAPQKVQVVRQVNRISTMQAAEVDEETYKLHEKMKRKPANNSDKDDQRADDR